VDVVLVAGDVFDQAVPTAGAEDLFYETMDKLTENSERVVVVIAGNHDDPKRLTAGVHFAKKHNVIIISNLHPDVQKRVGQRITVESFAQGSVCVTVKTSRGEQKCNIAALPYPQEYRLEEKAEAETYAGKVTEWARKVCKGFNRGGVNILLTHLMLVGGLTVKNNEERIIRVGDINAIGKADLPKADYYALGHLHSFQNQKGNFVYSGAPLFLDPMQKTAGVCLIDCNNQGIRNIAFKPIKSTNRVVEVEIEENEMAEDVLKEFSPEDFVNVTFVQNEPLKSDFVKNLKQTFACVKQVKLRRLNLAKDDKNYVCSRASLDAETLFSNFYKTKKFAICPNTVLELFKELMEDKSSETN